MTIQDRMKKYAELRIAGIWNRHNTDALYEDFQAAMSALEVAREAISQLLPLAESAAQTEWAWNEIGTRPVSAAKERYEQATKALSTINEIMGEK